MNPKLDVYFLGTGTSQGIPVIGSTHPVCLSDDSRDKRLRVSIRVKSETTTLVVDCGPDFRQQMLRSQTTKLDAILFTHEHADHTAGLDDIRPFSLTKGALPIYVSQAVNQNLRSRFAYIFDEENRYPGAPEVHVNIIEAGKAFTVGDIEILPIEAKHGNLPILGFRFGKVAYMTDVKTLSAEALNQLLDLDVLIINALRFEPHATHLNIDEALAIIEQLRPKKTYFTHISHYLGFHESVSKALPENIELAYDNLEIKIP
jgi:phosphoribosyl 1,2-cyclic phosphate phosphodiesterase